MLEGLLRTVEENIVRKRLIYNLKHCNERLFRIDKWG